MSSRLPLASPMARLLLLFAVIAVVLPILGGYELTVATDLIINLILVVSFRFITTMGRWSFAHVALAGAGGYTSAILTTQVGLPFWGTLFLGGLVAGLLALLLSFPTMRTTGFYFFMSTFAAGALIVWTWTAFIVPFGGTSGIYGVRPPPPIDLFGILTLPVGSPLGYAYVVAGAAFVSLAVLLRLERTRLGSVLRAIRWHTPLAMSVGLNVRKYETFAFVVGSSFAGIAGVLFVHKTGIAFPNDFGTLKGITIVMFTVVGGAESFWGPMLGAFAMTLIAQGIQQYPELVSFTPLVFGLLTIVIVLAFPGGLVTVPARLRALASRGGPGTAKDNPAWD